MPKKINQADRAMEVKIDFLEEAVTILVDGLSAYGLCENTGMPEEMAPKLISSEGKGRKDILEEAVTILVDGLSAYGLSAYDLCENTGMPEEMAQIVISLGISLGISLAASILHRDKYPAPFCRLKKGLNWVQSNIYFGSKNLNQKGMVR